MLRGSVPYPLGAYSSPQTASCSARHLRCIRHSPAYSKSHSNFWSQLGSSGLRTPPPTTVAVFGAHNHDSVIDSWLGAPFSTLARQCRSLAIQINRYAGDPISPRFLKFFAYKKIARPNWDANSWQNMLSDDTDSLRHLPRRSSKNCDLQFANTDRFEENYSIDGCIY